jgi:hypothetical protein
MKYHATYGELLNSKQVSELTGFTMNQLRNWRSPSRRNLAPFGYLSIGGTCFYRKLVVEAWVAESGPQVVEYHPTSFDERFPLSH